MQQIFTGVRLRMTKSADGDADTTGFSHPLDSVEYDGYRVHERSIDDPLHGSVILRNNCFGLIADSTSIMASYTASVAYPRMSFLKYDGH